MHLYPPLSVFQLHGAGWMFPGVREQFADRVFAPLYGTEELHVSKDGWTFQRPTYSELNRTPNDHFDQGSTMKGLQCIQGSVALTDQEEEDGCFSCWPGSHKHHDEIIGMVSNPAWNPAKAKQDFQILNSTMKDVLRARGVVQTRVPVKKGDVVLWRSDLVHCGAPPIGARDNFRAVIYVCCLPALLTPEEAYPLKQQAYHQKETGCHWPCREEWFKIVPKRHGGAIPFFKKPPPLTDRQRLLHGLDRYPCNHPEGWTDDDSGGGGSGGAADARGSAAGAATCSPHIIAIGKRRYRTNQHPKVVGAGARTSAWAASKPEASAAAAAGAGAGAE